LPGSSYETVLARYNPIFNMDNDLVVLPDNLAGISEPKSLDFKNILFGIQHGAEVPEPNEEQEVHLPVPPHIINDQGKANGGEATEGRGFIQLIVLIISLGLEVLRRVMDHQEGYTRMEGTMTLGAMANKSRASMSSSCGKRRKK
jgi:hypothetical protein